MNIKVHTGRLLAICTVTGFALAAALVMGYRSVEKEFDELGTHSMALKEADNLRAQVNLYLGCSDFVLRGETYMLSFTLSLSQQLVALVDQISVAPLAADKLDQLSSIAGGVQAIQEVVEDSERLRDEDRSTRLEELRAETDLIATALVRDVEDLKLQLERRSRYNQEDLEVRRAFLQVLSWLAAALYILVVLMSWFWSVQTMVRPIERLSSAAELAHANNEAFEVEEGGPDEVRRLTRNISAFVRTRAEFLATMSHELRTPLNGILNMNELMLETQLSDEQRDFAESGKRAGEALLDLINAILDFSKIQARKLELEHAPFGLRQVIDEAVEILSSVAASKGIELGAIVAHDVPDAVVGDPTRLRQVLVNLLNNAVKFTADGEVLVRVAMESNSERVELRFEVADTGIGIPPERQGTLFQAFQQVDSSTTREYGGTGLGLAICKELTALMGGGIGVRSTVGEGSTFWFTIHVDAQGVDAVEMPRVSWGEDRVFVLSDRVHVRERVREQLRYLGIAQDAIHAPADPDEVLGDLQRAHDPWVLVDPVGASASVLEQLAPDRPDPGAPLRLAALENRLRKRRDGTRIPAGVRVLPDPSTLLALAGWLRGDAPTPSAGAPEEAGASSLQGVRVLAADDNPVNRRVAQAVLEREGCDVVTVGDGWDAVDHLTAHPCDVVLMDCHMPRMDGLEATRRIRRLGQLGEVAAGSADPLPVVGLTADAEESDRQACLSAGMTAFLAKPFRPEQLVAAVSEAVGRRGDAPVDAPAVAEPASSEPLPSTEAAGATRVLVVEDNKMNQRVIKAILERAKFEIIVTENGKEAVEYLLENRCDVVLMDCQMPVMDGWEATREIRQLESLGRLDAGCRAPLPILAVTANAMEGDRERCLEAGMDDYLTKPIKPKLLLEAIDSYLSGMASAGGR